MQKKTISQNEQIDNLTQKIDELSAGVLMLAELLGISVPLGYDDRDLISEIAVKIEQNSSDLEKARNTISNTAQMVDESLNYCKNLKDLLTEENLLALTRNCIAILETTDEESEGGGVILENNGALWEFISNLATAQGMDVPEYEP